MRSGELKTVLWGEWLVESIPMENENNVIFYFRENRRRK